MSPAKAEANTSAPERDNVIRFPRPDITRLQHASGIQPWRYAELPENVVVGAHDRHNFDLASGEILVVALIRALEKRSGLRTIAESVCQEVMALKHTKRCERVRAVDVLCDRRDLAGEH